MLRVPPAVRCLFLVSLSLLIHTAAPAAEETYSPLAPGLAYRHEVRAEGPLSIHAIRAERQNVRWDLRTGLGQDVVFGLEPLDGIVERTATRLRMPALAAINGDFFVIRPGPYRGDPRGVQILNGELLSRPTGNAFWVGMHGVLNIGPVASKLHVVWPDGKTEIPIGLNESRADDGVVLYSRPMCDQLHGGPPAITGTRTQGGRELVLAPVSMKSLLLLQVGATKVAEVEEIYDHGDTPIANGHVVLSIGPRFLAGLPPIRRGDWLQIVVATEPDLRCVETAIGAGRILIRGGKTPDLGPNDQPRHPRSMIGWNGQHLYFIVIDGRRPGVSMGMTYPEMAQLARQYGCTDAIEFDGGGSSTLWAMGKILNQPSDGKPRPIPNGLILFRDGVRARE